MKNLFNYTLLAICLVTCSGTENVPGEGELLLLWDLPGELPEASGMIEYDGLYWMINDGDRGPWIYGLDPLTGSLERTVYVNGSNIDWEEITQDENNIYIGDIGNNSGSRKDLRILIFDKAAFASDTISPKGTISYSYSDQSDFTPADQNNSFDCEAFRVDQGTVLLFSKDWKTLKTKVYSMPALPGTYSAQPKSTFDTKGLVTGAAYDKGKMVLVGYNPDAYYAPFLFIADDFSFNTASYGNRVRIDFPSSTFIQAESVIMTSNGDIRIASEANPLAFARMYSAKF